MSQKIRKRSVVTLVLLPSFILLALSGIALYIWPPKGVAGKMDFSLLGQDHDFWEDLHMMAGFLMILLFGFHIFMNFMTLKSHVVREERTADGPIKRGISKEFLIGLGFFLVIVSAALWNFFPESAIVELREVIREMWRASYRSS